MSDWFLPNDPLSSDYIMDLYNDPMLVIEGGDKTLMKGRSCYITCDKSELTLRHDFVVVPVST